MIVAPSSSAARHCSVGDHRPSRARLGPCMLGLKENLRALRHVVYVPPVSLPGVTGFQIHVSQVLLLPFTSSFCREYPATVFRPGPEAATLRDAAELVRARQHAWGSAACVGARSTVASRA